MNGFYVTGEADFILYVTARDMEGYERFTRRFFYKKPNIKRFTSTQRGRIALSVRALQIRQSVCPLNYS